MGLYINRNEHPDVFKNSRKITEPNQNITRKDFLSEVLDEQQQANVSLSKALDKLQLRFFEQADVQVSHWDYIRGQLNELRTSNLMHKEFEEQTIKWLRALDERNSMLQAANQLLSSQINEQINLQKQLSEKLSNQEDFQIGVLSRMDKQEALTEKISRQLNHIRSILFERTNYLAEKIDEGYKLTSSYVYNLMTGSDQPLAFHLLTNKVEKRLSDRR